MLAAMELILKFGRDAGKVKAMGQTDIFGVMSEEGEKLEEYKLEIPKLSEVSKKELLGWEKELMGMYLSDHPLGEYKNYLLKFAIACRDLTLDMDGQKVVMGGVVTKVQKIVTKKGDAMAFVTIEDLSGMVEVIVFPKIFAEDQEKWNEGKIVLLEGTISTKDNAVKILVNKAKEINLNEALDIKDDEVIEKKADNFLEIKIPYGTKKEKLILLKEILENNIGESDLFLVVTVQGESKKIKSKIKIAVSSDLKNQIHTLLHEGEEC
jgi:DNA polymerase-3 subunit alpha